MSPSRSKSCHFHLGLVFVGPRRVPRAYISTCLDMCRLYLSTFSADYTGSRSTYHISVTRHSNAHTSGEV